MLKSKASAENPEVTAPVKTKAKSNGKPAAKRQAAAKKNEDEPQQSEAAAAAVTDQAPSLQQIIKRDRRSAPLSNQNAEAAAPKPETGAQQPVPFTRQPLTNANRNHALPAKPAVRAPGAQVEVTSNFLALCGQASEMLLREKTVSQSDVRALLYDRKSLLQRDTHTLTFIDCGKSGSNTNFKIAIEDNTGQRQEVPFGDKFVRLFHIPGKKK